MDLGLERVAAVSKHLAISGHGDDSTMRIVVAGTNGKGSSIAMLESIYTAAGYRVGCYTSPHLHHYCERIRFDGHLVDDDAVCAAFEVIEEQRGEVPLTFFEFGTLAALMLLDAERLDVQLLEVGLGGRLDAVNIVDGDAALLTSIDFDHSEWLGDSRAQIGLEKAAVMRPGKVAVCGDQDLPASVVEYGRQQGARLFRAGVDYGYQRESHESWRWWGRQNQQNLERVLPRPALAGDFQLINAAAVVQLVSLLDRQLPVSTEQLSIGLKATTLAGRFEIRSDNPELIIDVAHNPQACAALAGLLVDRPLSGRRLAVVGMNADKEIPRCLGFFSGLIDHWYFASLPSPRGATAEQLHRYLRQAGCQRPATLHTDPESALAAARADASGGDQLVMFGSFLTAAAAG